MVEFRIGDRVIERIDEEDRPVATVIGVWREHLWLDTGASTPTTVLAMDCRPENVPAENYGENK